MIVAKKKEMVHSRLVIIYIETIGANEYEYRKIRTYKRG